MRQSSKGEGTKIAQAAKDLNVTSVTIRRYLAEFDIATTSDENGVKVLPPNSMEELKEIRRLKEEGLTNPKVMEILEESRTKTAPAKGKAKDTRKESAARASRAVKEEDVEDEDESEEEEEEQKPSRPAARRIQKPERGSKNRVEKVAAEAESEAETAEEEGEEEQAGDIAPQVRAKHSLTCQTCGKVFEHMNPRLRDCLDCYRTKRKERRRGGSDRHKNVIQHPLAQQAATKSAQQSQQSQQQSQPQTTQQPAAYSAPAHRTSTVRNYRKAIEETRGLTSNLKRRLERPDLPEGERRWLEQIYAYQLILHQGWRHLADYKSNSQQGKGERHAAATTERDREREGPNANGY